MSERIYKRLIDTIVAFIERETNHFNNRDIPLSFLAIINRRTQDLANLSTTCSTHDAELMYQLYQELGQFFNQKWIATEDEMIVLEPLFKRMDLFRA